MSRLEALRRRDMPIETPSPYGNIQRVFDASLANLPPRLPGTRQAAWACFHLCEGLEKVSIKLPGRTRRAGTGGLSLHPSPRA